MISIEIDFEVYKALTLRRVSEEVTYNDVLREILKLGASKKSDKSYEPAPQTAGWTVKGVTFPNGTDFRASHKGQVVHGRVESGALVINSRRFDSPSAAAVAITGNPVNGWVFWECRVPGKTDWQIIKALRKR